MPLDFTQISAQIEQLTQRVTGAEMQRRIELAHELIRSTAPGEMREAIDEHRRGRNRVPWLTGRPVEELGVAIPAPDAPADFVVVAADGSNIPPERHSPARFYVLNTGRVALGYGREPFADMTTGAQLFYDDRDLYFSSDDEDAEQTVPVEGAVLGAKMAVAELRALWETASAQARDPRVALSDGTLILWPIQSQSKAVRAQFIGKYRALFDRFHAAQIPVAAYLSKPGTQDVVNSLRLTVKRRFDKDNAQPGNPDSRAYADLEHVRDFEAFGWLKDGERSDIFSSSSQVLNEYGTHAIEFFYLNVGGEIARVEAPQWVMRKSELASFLHAVIMDQCRRSPAYPPYPPILQEAHETAVIPTGDRQAIELMIDDALAAHGLTGLRGAKDRSKRVRAI
ncbi:MAG: DNA double-strand break repair nuclease NurA [Chloroflexi bacterium]|nr:DNA double-strand break repair nuclease NurA [Chloroflexota bacterium]